MTSCNLCNAVSNRQVLCGDGSATCQQCLPRSGRHVACRFDASPALLRVLLVAPSWPRTLPLSLTWRFRAGALPMRYCCSHFAPSPLTALSLVTACASMSGYIHARRLEARDHCRLSQAGTDCVPDQRAQLIWRAQLPNSNRRSLGGCQGSCSSCFR